MSYSQHEDEPQTPLSTDEIVAVQGLLSAAELPSVMQFISLEALDEQSNRYAKGVSASLSKRELVLRGAQVTLNRSPDTLYPDNEHEIRKIPYEDCNNRRSRLIYGWKAVEAALFPDDTNRFGEITPQDIFTSYAQWRRLKPFVERLVDTREWLIRQNAEALDLHFFDEDNKLYIIRRLFDVHFGKPSNPDSQLNRVATYEGIIGAFFVYRVQFEESRATSSDGDTSNS